MIERDVKMTASVVMMIGKMDQTAKTEKVCVFQVTIYDWSFLTVIVSLDPLTSAHDELDTAE